MTPPFDIAGWLEARTRHSAASLESLGPDFQPMIRPADPQFGDFQANGVLPHAKRNRLNPRETGSELARLLEEDPEIRANGIGVGVAGPGFINFRLPPRFLTSWLKAFSDESALREGASAIFNGRRFVVDFSSPNTAKQMHVGHIRSTVMDTVLFSAGGVSADERGIWVADPSAPRIAHFDWSGNLLGYAGSRGQGPGEFLRPYQIDLDTGL